MPHDPARVAEAKAWLAKAEAALRQRLASR